MTYQPTPNDPAAIVDALGRIKAEAAALAERETVLKDALKATGLTAVDGAAYRATISAVEAERVDSARVRALLDDLVARKLISPQRRTAMFSKSLSTVIRVTARRVL